MKKITLSKGQVTLIDDEYYEKFNTFKWYLDAHGYVRRTLTKSEKNEFNNKTTRMMLHQEILGKAPLGFEIDHIDRNKLNNQKSNLRFVSRRENNLNRKIPKHNKSGLRGVHFYKITNKWRATIRINGKDKHLGYFNQKEEAGRAYNKAWLIYNGKLND